MSTAFEAALVDRVEASIDACTQCGKCVEACPVTDAAGVQAQPVDVINGIIDVLRGGVGTEDARQWASSCVLTGECISACDYGVNPRFLLGMTRVALARAGATPQEQRKRGVENFRKVNREVTTLLRLQVDDEVRTRLAQGAQADGASEAPDFIFYTGCNVLRTPHIALLCLDVMDALDVSYRVMGGPTHCCGVVQLRTGDVETSGRVAQNTIDKLSQSKKGEVISWCPTCYVQFTETSLPAAEKVHGAKPFEMTPFMRFLRARLDDLEPLMVHPVAMRVALHRHPGVAGVTKAVEEILRAVPGLELVDLDQPAVGLQSSSVAALPALRRDLQRRELDAAESAGIDALLAIYHTDYRELCAHEGERPFRILNALEVIAESMRLAWMDRYKQLKLMQEVDAILEECGPHIEQHQIDPAIAREVVTVMLKEQPLALRGAPAV